MTNNSIQDAEEYLAMDTATPSKAKIIRLLITHAKELEEKNAALTKGGQKLSEAVCKSINRNSDLQKQRDSLRKALEETINITKSQAKDADKVNKIRLLSISHLTPS